MKNGKKSVEDKANPYGHYFSQKLLEVPAALKAELVAQGLEWRWINGQEYKDNGGMHRDYWKPYIQKKQDTGDGSNPLGEWAGEASGVIRRKDLILGVRPKLMGDAHRAKLTDRAMNYGKAALAKARGEVVKAAIAAGAAAPHEDEE